MPPRPAQVALIGPPHFTSPWQRAVRSMREVQVAHISESLSGVLGQVKQIECVVVSSWPELREAASVGVPTLLDNSVAAGLAEVTATIDECLRLPVDWRLAALPRYTPGCRAIHEALLSSQLGTPGVLRAHEWAGLQQPVTAAQAIGLVDFALAIFQEVPTIVYARTTDDRRQLHVHCGFPNSGMSMFDLVTALPSSNSYGSVTLIGSDGAAYLDDQHNAQLLFHGSRPTALVTDAGNGLAAALRELVADIGDEAKRAAFQKHMLQVLEIVRAIDASLSNDSAVRRREERYVPA